MKGVRERESIFNTILIEPENGTFVLPDLDDGVYSKEFIKKNHLVSVKQYKKMQRIIN